MTWSPSADRREVPFRSGCVVERTTELQERIAIWEWWLSELGGCSFIEPPSGTFSLVAFQHGAWTTILRGLRRREAIDLVATMREAGFLVRFERTR